MDWTELIDALGDRARAERASAFRSDGPSAGLCGVYGWWADDVARHAIEQALGADVAPFIYVGKAGGAHSVQTFGARILGNHLNGSNRTSTFRQSLTAILLSDPVFAAAHPNPRALAARQVVSSWMREHLAVAVVAVGGPEDIEAAEDAAIARYDPPLNLRGVARTPSRMRLRELRRDLRRRVRAAASEDAL